MKRKLLSVLLCFLVLSVMVLPAYADTLPRVVDQADLLTPTEEAELEEKALSLWDSCQLDVVIVTVNSTDGKSVQTYADDYYDEHAYGYGSDYSGILLLIDMDSREWYISTCGEAIYIFTDYGLDEMGEDILPKLSSGDYHGAFDTWLDLIPYYCEQYENGKPIDGYVTPDAYEPESGDEIVYYDSPSPLGSIWVALLVGAVIAAVAVWVMYSQMNTAKAQKNAVQYIKNGSYNLHTHRDLFLYSRVNRTPRPKQTSSGSRGGGSSVHRSSGGRRHGGRGGRF